MIPSLGFFPVRVGSFVSSATKAPRSDSLRPLYGTDSVRFRSASPTLDLALDDLAKANGIELVSYAPGSEGKRPSNGQIQSVLQVMGYPIEQLQQADKVLALVDDMTRAAWKKPLPPVLVRPESHVATGIPLEITLPEEAASQSVSWQLQFESGKTVSGSLTPAELKPMTSKNLDGKIYRRYRAMLPVSKPEWGYHQLTVDKASTHLIVTPDKAYLPKDMGKIWGPTVQLYALKENPRKHRHDMGAGDLTTGKRLAEWVKSFGAAFVGINPIATPNLQYPQTASPYDAISNAFFNPLTVDVTRVPNYQAWQKTKAAQQLLKSSEIRQALAQARKNAYWVEYPQIAKAKMTILNALFQHQAQKPNPAFEAYLQEKGALLTQFATFQAIQEAHQGKPWQQWPETLQSPDSPHVQEFKAQHPERVRFYAFLQWVTETQLKEFSSVLPMRIYMDRPVGANRGGFDTWRWPVFMREASIGCPPDGLAPLGQNWGFPVPHPKRLEEAGYAPFVESIRTAMRYAGILREDHAFKLQRLFIVPPNTTSYNGLYVHYNADDLLGIIALESHRNKCVVIGEDLGTAPPGFKEKLKAWRILGYDVTRFQRHWDQKPQEPPIDPEAYRDLAIAVASNHDVSTLAGLVLGYHWQTLKSLGENSPAIDESMRAEQRYLAGDLQALYDRGLLSPEVTVDKIRQELATELTNVNAKKAKPAYDAFVNAMTRYLSGARSLVYGAQLEDVMGVREQINIPNTIEHTDDVPKSHPDEIPHRRNWRRRLPMTLDEMKRDVRFKTLFSLLKRDRGISG